MWVPILQDEKCEGVGPVVQQASGQQWIPPVRGTLQALTNGHINGPVMIMWFEDKTCSRKKENNKYV